MEHRERVHHEVNEAIEDRYEFACMGQGKLTGLLRPLGGTQ